jgi:hypothetical protein
MFAGIGRGYFFPDIKEYLLIYGLAATLNYICLKI